MKEIIVENLRCFIGKNAKENWYILSRAKPMDLFFHLSEFPSCYVILETKVEENFLDENILAQCARICLENTKYRNMKGIYVDYTFVYNVKKGSAVGEIEYTSLRKIKKIKL